METLLDDIPCSSLVRSAIDRYDTVGDRPAYLWRWVQQGLQLTTLSSVSRVRAEDVCETKLLGVILTVLWDDIADDHDDPELLACLLEIPRGGSGPLRGGAPWRQRTLEVTRWTWAQFSARVARLPGYSGLRDVFAFDVEGTAQSMRYSALLRRLPALVNPVEHRAHLPANMVMVLNGTIDLMASPGFRIEELGPMREVLVLGQRMGRIGNAVSTWEREAGQGDWSSDVFALALRRGVIGLQDLRRPQPERLVRAVRAAGLEAVLLQEWQDLRRMLVARVPDIESVNVAAVVRGLDDLLQMHLSSRGHK